MEYFLLILLVLCSAFFSSAETAFSSANRLRLKHYAESKNKKAKKALEIIENYDKALSAILIGNNIVNIAAASIGTVIFTNISKEYGAVLATAVMTVVVLIFGEVLPKSIAKENSTKLSIGYAYIIYAIIIVFSPIISFLLLIKKPFGTRDSSKDTSPSVTEEELKYIIEEIEDEGVLEKHESELLQSALEFEDKTVSKILTPRVNVVGVELSSSLEEIRELIFNEGYSRIPVYEGNLDHIVGIVNSKSFLHKLYKGENFSLQSILGPVLYVPPTKKISHLLRELQKAKQHMAVVTDQYGGTLGIVTMEDTLEELVGEIYDESDEIMVFIKKLSETSFEVLADTEIEALSELIGFEVGEDEVNAKTVAGLAFEMLERMPQNGDRFEIGGFTITIIEADEQHVIKTLFDKLPDKAEENK